MNDLKQAALEHHLANRLDQAEMLYLQALELSADEPDCLHMLGVVCLQTGRYQEATAHIIRALTLTDWKIDTMRQNLSLASRFIWDDSILWDRAADRLGMARPEVSKDVDDIGIRVLVVDSDIPRPNSDSGSVRLTAILHLLRKLGCQVTFAPYLPSRYVSDQLPEGMEILQWPESITIGQALASRGDEFELIFFSRYNLALPHLTQLRHYAPQALFVFDTVDLHHLREMREAEISDSAESMRQAAVTRTLELSVVNQADVTLVVSEFEQRLLSKEAPSANTMILSNIHPIRGRQADFRKRRDIFFVGGFMHRPNVDAVKWYANEIWPDVRDRLPGIRTFIVGSNMPKEVADLEQDGIVCVGYAEDLSPYLDGCRLSIAPLRVGAGVKGKISMAQSSGVPVVATSIAVEGMHLENGDNVLLADSAKDFAAAVVRLYSDEGLWKKLSDNGMENVSKYFSPESAESRLLHLIRMAKDKRDRYRAGENRASIQRSHPEITRSTRNYLILLPAGYGSFGDEAMVNGLLAGLDIFQHDCHVDLLNIQGVISYFPIYPGVRRVINLSQSKTNMGASLLEKLRSILPDYDAFGLIGADILDGHYSAAESNQRLSFVELAGNLGLTTLIFGFSFNDSPHPDVLAPLSRLAGHVHLLVRDPASQRRLITHGIDGIDSVADLAFLMPPTSSSQFTEAIENWIKAEKSQGRQLLILNISEPTLAQMGRQKDRHLEELAEWLAELIAARQTSVLFLPHDLRLHGEKRFSDVALAVEMHHWIADRLGHQDHHRYFIPGKASQAKRLAGLADIVITGRMHLAIAALGMGVPIIGITYQDKFEGLCELFGLSENLINARDFSMTRFKDIYTNKCSQLVGERELIEAHLPIIMEAANKNISCLTVGGHTQRSH